MLCIIIGKAAPLKVSQNWQVVLKQFSFENANKYQKNVKFLSNDYVQ